MSTELSTWLHRSGYLSRETRGRGARLSKSTVTLSIPGSTVRMSTNDLAASDTGETCRQYIVFDMMINPRSNTCVLSYTL